MKEQGINLSLSAPMNGGIKGTVVISDGMPSSKPFRNELHDLLNTKGYANAQFNYKGTWESEGQFLAESPVEDLHIVVNNVKKNLSSTLDIDVKDLPINIIGSSFGGAVALCMTGNKNVNKIVVFSPITDFKNLDESVLSSLKGYLLNDRKNDYRFNEDNWDSMQNGELFNPPHSIESSFRDKILIVADDSDPEIKMDTVQQYAEANGIKFISTKGKGHLSFKNIPQETRNEVFAFLED